MKRRIAMLLVGPLLVTACGPSEAEISERVDAAVAEAMASAASNPTSSTAPDGPTGSSSQDAGSSTTAASVAPIRTRSGDEAISLWDDHACFIPARSDDVRCWGIAGLGSDIWLATDLPAAFGRPTEVDVSYRASCALVADLVVCWDIASSTGPIQGSDAIVVDAAWDRFATFDQSGDSYCGLTEAGKVLCVEERAGANPDAWRRFTGTYAHVAFGLGDLACAVSVNTRIECFGAVGVDEEPGPLETPPEVDELVAEHLSFAWGRRICALGANQVDGPTGPGNLVCWSWGWSPQAPSLENVAVEDVVVHAGAYMQVDATSGSECAVTIGGEVSCWGQSAIVAGVPQGSTWVAVAVDGDVACAVGQSDEVECWGDGARELLAGPSEQGSGG